jgi:oxygen-independent coproporphyrinogen-3 oxidase
MNSLLLKKYNVPAPRYTSYPTVPYWNNEINTAKWKLNFQKQFSDQNKNGISLYIHLPFCESLCTYCGCNKKITTNHGVEERYIEAVVKEWKMYVELMSEPPLIREIHLGGGTPTFFSAKNLEKLLQGVINKCNVHAQHEFSIEAHPNYTSAEQLDTLNKLGFKRISFGVQDNNPEVQRIINRIQPFENVKKATEAAREKGFSSINFDLIYGLPLQTETSVATTIKQSISLQPDRVAFYSYAHVPWTSRGQRLFNETDLPNAELKLKLYSTGKNLFLESRYHDIGMDHFSLESDDLYHAYKNGSLHRNFMGYVTHHTSMLIGLGVSSISDAGNAFAQNKKSLHEYYMNIESKELPLQKGYFLDNEDLLFRKHILDIMCKGSTWLSIDDTDALLTYTFPELQNLQNDGLIKWDGNLVKVTRTGHSFLRNICSAFDIHLLKSNKNKLYSRAI